MSSQPERVAVVIEDDADIRNLLEAILGQAGFTCHSAEDGVAGIAAVREHQPILTTLDISLPGIDGFEVARRIRAFSMTYIVMLSARDEEIDTLMGLDAGADDYLTKPFRPRELRARIEAMLRRYHQVQPVGAPTAGAGTGGAAGGGGATGAGGRAGASSGGAGGAGRAGNSGRTGSPGRPAGGGSGGGTTTTANRAGGQAGASNDSAETDDSGWLSHNGLRINADMWLCDLDGAPLELTRSEFDLLLAIMLGQRRVISKDTLALELRGEYTTGAYVSDSDRRAVEVHMANLRRKLNDPVSKPRYIETVRGVGYRLAEPD